MENQRFILYASLCLVLYLIWGAWQEEQEVPQQIAAGQSPSVEQATEWQNDLPESVEADALTEQALTKKQALKTTQQESKVVTVKTDVFEIKIDTRGADIHKVELKNYPVSLEQKDTPLVLLDNESKTYITQSGLIHDRVPGKEVNKFAPNHHDLYQVEETNFQLENGQQELSIPFQWRSQNGVVVTKTFVFKRGSYLIEVNYDIQNESNQAWSGRQYKQLRHSYVASERSLFRLPTYTGSAYYDQHYEKLSFDDMRDEPLNKEVTGGWVAMLEHYFFSAWLAGKEENNLYYSNTIDKQVGTDYIIGMRSSSVRVNPKESISLNNRFYAGPKLQNEIKEIQPGLELTTDYGIFTPLCKPLFWVLNYIHSWVDNWGWAIIFVTLLIKIVFYRLSAASYKSMARMRKVQPRFQAIRERYGNDKQKLNQAMMDLYRKEKINPVGGCLPILIQMPVFLSLYWVLIESVELRQAPFMLWINDLSTKDPIYVLPLLMGISMFVQFKLNPKPPDPMQEKIFMIMPVLMAGFMAVFPAGLVLYWVVNNTLSIAQQWYITRKYANE